MHHILTTIMPNTINKPCGSPGLAVMGRDSRPEGRWFESWPRILDGHFFTYICCKNCIVCLKRPKINEKEAGVGPIKKNKPCYANDNSPPRLEGGGLETPWIMTKSCNQEIWFFRNVGIYNLLEIVIIKKKDSKQNIVFFSWSIEARTGG